MPKPRPKRPPKRSDHPGLPELPRALCQGVSGIRGVPHGHGPAGTAFAQGATEIPCYGTTHADHFNGPVPVTRLLRPKEVREDYEGNTGKVIVERFGRGLDPLHVPAALVAGHGPFTWGRTAGEAVRNSLVLEMTAKMAVLTWTADDKAAALPGHILKKHFERKHGPNAYYGQKRKRSPRK